MNRSSLIGHVVELHESVRSHSQPADNTVKEFFRKRHYLGSRDRRFISETLYGILRNSLLLEATIDSVLASAGENGAAFRKSSVAFYVAYALKLIDAPPESVLQEAAGLWRSMIPTVDLGNFVKAIITVDPLQPYQSSPVRRIALQYSFPDEIVEEWCKRFGEEETDALCSSLNSQAPTTVRVNTLKAERARCLQSLIEDGIECEETTFSPIGITLKKRVSIQSLNSFRNGYFEIQDEGSQLLGYLTEARPGMTIIDACAGGGGKTLHLSSLMKNEGNLIAIDIHERRLHDLQERANRAGAHNVRTLLMPRDIHLAKEWENKADIVLIDAPCSGVGTFRRNPAAKLDFNSELSDRLAKTQRNVLVTYSPLVKPGGRIVYATCTLLQQENEDIVEWFLSTNSDFSLLNAGAILNQQVAGSLKDYASLQGTMKQSAGGESFLTLLPHRTNTDGFFAAVMEKSKLIDS